MNKRQQQKLETRQKIRENARQLFIEKGFEGATSREIAKRSGVALGTLFVHFENKNDILDDILYEDIEATVKESFISIDPQNDIVSTLMHLARSLYTYYESQIDLSRALLKNSLFQTSNSTNFALQISAFIEAVTGLIEDAQKKGELRNDKNAKTMATAFMGSYFIVLIALIRDESLNSMLAIEQLEEQTRCILS